MDPLLRQFLRGGCPNVLVKGAGETDADRDILTGCGGRIVSRRGGAVFGRTAGGQGKSQ